MTLLLFSIVHVSVEITRICREITRLLCWIYKECAEVFGEITESIQRLLE